jgi:hypothetical protein
VKEKPVKIKKCSELLMPFIETIFINEADNL